MLFGLYTTSTYDTYPSFIIPAIFDNSSYLYYFIPFIGLFILLFNPVPMAAIYDEFKKHRLGILIKDRIKQRDSLF
jgi:two pore calcium channel protein 3